MCPYFASDELFAILSHQLHASISKQTSGPHSSSSFTSSLENLTIHSSPNRQKAQKFILTKNRFVCKQIPKKPFSVFLFLRPVSLSPHLLLISVIIMKRNKQVARRVSEAPSEESEKLFSNVI
jgi:hypothetical protein